MSKQKIEKWTWEDLPASEEGRHCSSLDADVDEGDLGGGVLFHQAGWPVSPDHKALIAAAPRTKRERDKLLEACEKACRANCIDFLAPAIALCKEQDND